jgi:hypothetical protein
MDMTLHHLKYITKLEDLSGQLLMVKRLSGDLMSSMIHMQQKQQKQQEANQLTHSMDH